MSDPWSPSSSPADHAPRRPRTRCGASDRRASGSARWLGADVALDVVPGAAGHGVDDDGVVAGSWSPTSRPATLGFVWWDEATRRRVDRRAPARRGRLSTRPSLTVTETLDPGGLVVGASADGPATWTRPARPSPSDGAWPRAPRRGPRRARRRLTVDRPVGPSVAIADLGAPARRRSACRRPARSCPAAPPVDPSASRRRHRRRGVRRAGRPHPPPSSTPSPPADGLTATRCRRRPAGHPPGRGQAPPGVGRRGPRRRRAPRSGAALPDHARADRRRHGVDGRGRCGLGRAPRPAPPPARPLIEPTMGGRVGTAP